MKAITAFAVVFLFACSVSAVINLQECIGYCGGRPSANQSVSAIWLPLIVRHKTVSFKTNVSKRWTNHSTRLKWTNEDTSMSVLHSNKYLFASPISTHTILLASNISIGNTSTQLKWPSWMEALTKKQWQCSCHPSKAMESIQPSTYTLSKKPTWLHQRLSKLVKTIDRRKGVPVTNQTSFRARMCTLFATQA